MGLSIVAIESSKPSSAEYLVDERLSHPLGIKVCPTCSAEAEAETAVDRESPATPEGHREEDAGGNRS